MGKSNGRFDPKETIAARIPIGEMVIDPTYQGHVNQALVDRIAKAWNESAAGAIILNLRDSGEYAVLDGQHRVRAAALAGAGELPALVFIGKSLEEEASLFVQLNTKHNVRPMDRFRANLKAGGVAEKNVRRALQELGLDVALSGPGDDKLQCAGALLKVYSTYGLTQFKVIAGILQAAFSAYPDRARGYRADAWLGLAQFLTRFPQADTSRVIDLLKSKGPTVMAGLALSKREDGEDAGSTWGKALHGIYNQGYNKNARGRLDDWKYRAYSETGKKKASARALKSQLIQSKMRRITTEDHRHKTVTQ